MKFRKLVSSLIIGGSLSLSLSACIPNAGDDNDPTRTGNNSYGAGAQSIQKDSTDSTAREYIDYFGKGAIEGMLDLPMGPFKMISKFTLDGILRVIFGEQKDQKMELLKEMDAKLDNIVKDLNKVLNITTQTNDDFARYVASTKAAGMDRDFIQIQDFAAAVKAKHEIISRMGLFGDTKTSELDQLYKYAAAVDFSNPKHSIQYTSALDAENISIKSLGAKSVSSDTKAERLFDKFNEYFNKQSGDLKLLNALKNKKSEYLAALGHNLAGNKDFYNKVLMFNGRVLVAKSEIFASYQRLYDIQLAQLAYMFAHNLQIPMTNVPEIVTIKEHGIEGFKKAVWYLNQAYNKEFNSVVDNVKDTLAPINDQELYALINDGVISKDNRYLLDKKSFVQESNKVTPGVCTITNFTFNEVQNRTGVATLSARCLKEYNSATKIATYVSTSIDIPYVMNEVGKITKYAVSGIYFDSQTNQLKSANQSGNTSTDFNSEDVNKLCNTEKDKIGRNWNMIEAADNHFYDNGGGKINNINFRLYQKFSIKFDSNTYIYPVEYTNKSEEDSNLVGLPGQSWISANSGYASSIAAKQTAVEQANYPGRHTRIVSYIGLAGGKAFCVRLQAYHTDQRSENATMEFGVYGVAGDAEHTNRDNLNFSNGSSLKINGYINEKGKLNNLSLTLDKVKSVEMVGNGIWNVTTSLPVSTYEKVNLSK